MDILLAPSSFIYTHGQTIPDNVAQTANPKSGLRVAVGAVLHFQLHLFVFTVQAPKTDKVKSSSLSAVILSHPSLLNGAEDVKLVRCHCQ
jgi:hypothetical protein